VILRRAWRAISGTLNALAEGIAETRRMSRLYDELAAMRNSELHDIGIDRVDTQAVITGHIADPPSQFASQAIGEGDRYRRTVLTNGLVKKRLRWHRLTTGSVNTAAILHGPF
jgi:uncharacterized protein YjiS (DUF1127 family)